MDECGLETPWQLVGTLTIAGGEVTDRNLGTTLPYLSAIAGGEADDATGEPTPNACLAVIGTERLTSLRVL